MKVILIGPRTFNGYIDSIVWNFQLPLQSLGHEVFLLDTTKRENDRRLQELIDEVEPDLLFSILSVGNNYPFYEPVDTIKKYTDNGKIKTFNWFADDVWRFSSFSAQMCFNFTACSTTEPSHIQKYKDIGYENIYEANWHNNEDLYSHHRDENKLNYDVTFIGQLYPERSKYIDFCKANDIKINVFKNLSFEQMISVMSRSKICLNFSSNPNASNSATQMKGRMFEIPATGALMLTEYHDGLEKYYEENKEAVFFRNKEELVTKLKKLLDSPDIALKLSRQGFERFLSEHTSRHRLRGLLEWIETL